MSASIKDANDAYLKATCKLRSVANKYVVHMLNLQEAQIARFCLLMVIKRQSVTTLNRIVYQKLQKAQSVHGNPNTQIR